MLVERVEPLRVRVSAELVRLVGPLQLSMSVGLVGMHFHVIYVYYGMAAAWMDLLPLDDASWLRSSYAAGRFETGHRLS